MTFWVKTYNFLRLAVLEPTQQNNNLDFTLRKKEKLIKVSVGQHYLIVITSWLSSAFLSKKNKIYHMEIQL